ncbi:MAG: hypothetical protein R2708_02140 [Vicinamibacterales bacterium]
MKVHVRVVEARGHGGAPGADDARGGTGQRLDFLGGTHPQDRVPLHGDGLRAGACLIGHVHRAVQDHQVGDLGRRGGCAAAGGKRGQDDEQEQDAK